jgi:PilZ domain
VRAKAGGRRIHAEGTTVKLSESGASGFLRVEFEPGQKVEVQLSLSAGPVTIAAVMRHRMGARYGFELLALSPEQAHKIRASCLGSPLTDQACPPNSHGPDKSLLTTHMPRKTCTVPF